MSQFQETAMSAGHLYGLFPRNAFGLAAAQIFIDHMPRVPDDLLAESHGDVMTHNVETGDLAFPTENLRNWALSTMERHASHFDTCNLRHS